MPANPATDVKPRTRRSVAAALLVAAGCLGLCGLGLWQLGRYHQKQALWDDFADGASAAVELPRAAEPPTRYAHVRVSGRYLTEHQFLLDNMSHEGEAGYRVLTPLERDHGETVLVDRGWVPRRSSGRTPDLSLTTDTVELTGRVDLLPRRGIDLPEALGKDAPGRDWPRLMSFPKIDALERALGRPLYPQILLLDPDAANGFVRDWQPGGLPPAQHLGYAVTWFSCAATLLFLYLRRSRRPATRP